MIKYHENQKIIAVTLKWRSHELTYPYKVDDWDVWYKDAIQKEVEKMYPGAEIVSTKSMMWGEWEDGPDWNSEYRQLELI